MARRFAVGFALVAASGFAACAPESSPRADAPAARVAPPTDGESASALRAATAVATRLRLTLPATSGGALRLTDPRSGASVGVRLAGAADVAATVRDGLVVYPGAAPGGGDWTHRPSPDGDEDRVFFPRRPDIAEVAYELELGATVAGLRLVDRVLEVLDATGTPRLRVGRPTVVIADGRRVDAQPRLEGCAAETSPRAPWRRVPIEPGAPRCTLRVSWPPDVSYPAVLDPPWTATGSMTELRFLFAVASLSSGLVLAVGGYDDAAADSAELYDPSTGTWAATGGLAVKRASPLIAPLPQDRVLVTGGTFGATVAAAEVYDAAAGTFTPTGAMADPRRYAAIVALSDGRVLVAGGANQSTQFLATAELYDPALGTWTATGSLNHARSANAGVRLADGTVLVTGGVPGAAVKTVERYDPATGLWTQVADTKHDHEYHGSWLLPSGEALLFGGYPCCVAPAERYDPVADTWTDTANMLTARADYVAEVLLDGRVLAAAGVDTTTNTIASAEIYDPVADTWSAAGVLGTARRYAASALLPDGSVLVAGGQAPNLAHLASAERFGGLALGAPCTLAAECVGGICVDGVCCDGPCDGLCESCNAAGACVAVAAGNDPDDECADSGSPDCQDDGFCDGAGACEKYAVGSGCSPTPCTDPQQCAKGHCVDGICCDAACDGPCEACTVEKSGGGVDGHCGPVAKGTDPDDECAGPTGAACADILLCGGAGECVAASQACAPYACSGPDGCLHTCTGNEQCAAGAVCRDAQCTTDMAGCAGDDAQTSDGTLVPCAPYRCDPASGSCRSACRSIDDCADPNLCDTSGHCGPAPAASTDSGCGCRAVGRGWRSEGQREQRVARAAIALLLLAAALVRRLPRSAR